MQLAVPAVGGQTALLYFSQQCAGDGFRCFRRFRGWRHGLFPSQAALEPISRAAGASDDMQGVEFPSVPSGVGPATDTALNEYARRAVFRNFLIRTAAGMSQGMDVNFNVQTSGGVRAGTGNAGRWIRCALGRGAGG